MLSLFASIFDRVKKEKYIIIRKTPKMMLAHSEAFRFCTAFCNFVAKSSDRVKHKKGPGIDL